MKCPTCGSLIKATDNVVRIYSGRERWRRASRRLHAARREERLLVERFAKLGARISAELRRRDAEDKKQGRSNLAGRC